MKKIKKMLPFLIMIMLWYYFLPALIDEFDSFQIIFVAVISFVCLLVSFVYGMNNAFHILYPVFVAVLYIPSMLTMRDVSVWGAAVMYGIFAAIGNAIGVIFYKRNVRIKNLEKYGRYFTIAVVGSYVLAVIVSGIMMSQMIKMTYNPIYFFSEREDVINFKENTVQQNYYHYGELEDHKEKALGTAEKIKIKVICSFTLFPLWRRSYNNPYICDGDQYLIVRKYENGESVTYGSNAYPLTYWLVMTAFKD